MDWFNASFVMLSALRSLDRMEELFAADWGMRRARLTSGEEGREEAKDEGKEEEEGGAAYDVQPGESVVQGAHAVYIMEASRLQMPSWQVALLNRLSNEGAPMNVRLFLLKVRLLSRHMAFDVYVNGLLLCFMQLLLQRHHLFCPWASQWLLPLMKLAVDVYHAQERGDVGGTPCLHYLLRDLVQVLITWRHVLPRYAHLVEWCWFRYSPHYVFPSFHRPSLYVS